MSSGRVSFFCTADEDGHALPLEELKVLFKVRDRTASVSLTLAAGMDEKLGPNFCLSAIVA